MHSGAKNSRQAQEKKATALIWLVPALWAVNYVVARKAPGVVGPYVLALGRWGLAAVLLIFLARSELWRQRGNVASHWWQYLLLGTCGMLICGAWVYQGARSTGTMNIALIYAASPVLIALGAVMWLGESFGVRQGAGVALALGGVLHVVVKGHWTALGDVQFSAGDGWIVAATFAWAAYAVLQKKWPSPLSATARLAAICTGGVVVLVPFAVWEFTQPDALPLGMQAVALMVVAALVPGIGAYWSYGWAQKILGAGRVAIALYLSPLYAAAVAWSVLGEPLGLHHAFGALLIFPGVYLVTRRSVVPLNAAIQRNQDRLENA